MPAVRHPCAQCKEKHVKCDEERPRCRRCQTKELPCTRPAKKTVFRHGSAASFSKDQKWVNSEARHFRYHARGRAAARAPLSPDRSTSPSTSAAITATRGDGHVRVTHGEKSAQSSPLSSLPAGSSPTEVEHMHLPSLDAEAALERNLTNSDSLGAEHAAGIQFPEWPSNANTPCLPPLPHVMSSLYGNNSNEAIPSVTDGHVSGPSHEGNAPSMACSPAGNGNKRAFPLENVQEACLLRYWIEEISHWFDLCDESRHFHLEVPKRARQYPHLLNAIFAVAARHLSRVPQYKTPQGIIHYHGQLLPGLHEHSAVEYMLQCMPALRQFRDDVSDDDYRDSIVATAVILRQLEEIDIEDDQRHLPSLPSGLHPSGAGKQVNFLAIIDAVLRSPPSQSVFGRRSLMQAAYWMALRQEIYHSFTRLEAPQLILPSEFWHIASPANKSVMHLVQVAKWKWGGCSAMEWSSLMEQQEHLENTVLADVKPIFKRSADKAQGEIFPTVWYRSNIDVTSMQFSLLAKSVLVAENPQLKHNAASRSSWRQVENDVRLLLLEQSGIALCNPASPPALVHAAFGIQVYGDFFTDHYERTAIRMVVERYRDAHAWPVQRLLEMFR